MTDRASLERYHGLDALRGFAMFLGILLHVGMSFMAKPLPFWPVWDDRRTQFAEVLLFSIHNFRMQLFFLLAGFFGCLLYTRYGWRQTTQHRLKRVGLPLVLAVVILQPAVQAISVYAASSAYREQTEEANGPRVLLEIIGAGDTAWEATREHFLTGHFLNYMLPAHFWFLWYLLLFFAFMLPVSVLGNSLRDTKIGRTWDQFWPWFFASRWHWVFLTAVTWVLVLPMQGIGGPDTPLSWYPNRALVGYYICFFVVGWALFRQRHCLARFVRPWRLALLLGNLVALPLALGLLFCSIEPQQFDITDPRPFRWLSQGATSIYCWCMIVGLIGLFQYCFTSPRAWVRWAADASYWCYLASLPLILLLQFIVKHWEFPSLVKLVGVTIVSMGLLLLSYQWGVRYTWLGQILNGPRQRKKRAPEPVEPDHSKVLTSFPQTAIGPISG